MSYSVEWIDPIFDREYIHVLYSMEHQDATPSDSTKGSYNYIDINRIENNIQYVAEDLLERKIINSPLSLRTNMNWCNEDILTRDDVNRIINNMGILQLSSNVEIIEQLEPLVNTNQMTFTLANAIEHNLLIMKNQPVPPPKSHILEIEHGIIVETGTSTTNMEEDTECTIRAVPYGNNAQWMVFDRWTGNTDDLQYVEDVYSAETKFLMRFNDVRLTAQFKVFVERTLTLVDAFTDDEERQTVINCYVGDIIPIVAAEAPQDMVFYEWRCTDEDVLENLVDGIHASTTVFVMPDKDVTLSSFYINPGKHRLKVNDGSGSGLYSYGETPTVICNDKGPKWQFTHWSGDVSYLYGADSGDTTVNMPDIGIEITANYTYLYSYNTVRVINGYGGGEEIREGTTTNITANEPPEGKLFKNWTVEGVGYAPSTNSGSFYVGDGNAVVTANYDYGRTIDVHNINNTGDTNSSYVLNGKRLEYYTSDVTNDNKRFQHWEENGQNISSSTHLTIYANSDRDITAVYSDRLWTDITIVNNGNTGLSNTTSCEQGYYHSWSATELAGDYIFDHWEENGEIISTSLTYGFTVGTTPRIITAVYRLRTTVYLNVTNGTGSGYYMEKEWVTCTANQPPQGQSFSNWSISGNIDAKYTYSSTCQIQMGQSDVTATAIYYTPTPTTYYTLTVENGSGSGTYSAGSGPRITANTPEEGYKFKQWELVSGSGSFYSKYSSSTYFYINGNSVVRAIYEEIPPITTYTLTVNNGRSEKGRGTQTYTIGSQIQVVADDAPDGEVFLRWDGDVDHDELRDNFASTGMVEHISKNMTITAIFYKPEEVETYQLVVEDGYGSGEYPGGTWVDIEAYDPPEGYEFYKWVGDIGGIPKQGIYTTPSQIQMPLYPIKISATYKREGSVTMYRLTLDNAYCLISYDADIWDTSGEFEEGSAVWIKAKDAPNGFNFNCWTGDPEAVENINDVNADTTYMIMPSFDVNIAAYYVEQDKYVVSVTNGQVSGTYREGDTVHLYFDKVDTDTEHYTFLYWRGSGLNYIDPTNPDQDFKMPAKDITFEAVYQTSYRVKINGGSIDGLQELYLNDGATKTLIADTAPDGKSFSRWIGNIELLDKPFNSQSSFTMRPYPVTLTSNYHTSGYSNSIGYTFLILEETSNIMIEDIIIINGKVEPGFLLTDLKGHIYFCDEVSGNTYRFNRLTKITEGGSTDE